MKTYLNRIADAKIDEELASIGALQMIRAGDCPRTIPAISQFAVVANYP